MKKVDITKQPDNSYKLTIEGLSKKNINMVLDTLQKHWDDGYMGMADIVMGMQRAKANMVIEEIRKLEGLDRDKKKSFEKSPVIPRYPTR